MRRERDVPEGEMPGGFPPDGGMPGGPPGGGRSVVSSDVNATFSNMTLNGDIIHGDTYSGAMNVYFEKATITAPESYSAVMTVDGVQKPIGAGIYEGRIELTVTSDT